MADLTRTQYARLRAITHVQRFLSAIYKRRMRRYPNLKNLFEELQRQSQSAAAGSADSIMLYEAVMKRRPEYILDLGTGDSGAVLAQAAIDAGYTPQIDAIEENEDWLAHHKRVIPQHLQPSINFMRLDRAVKITRGRRAAHYAGLPARPYGLVFVDGPSIKDTGTDVTGDVLDLLPTLAPSCMIIFDGREAAARYTAPYLAEAGFTMRRALPMFSYVFTRG